MVNLSPEINKAWNIINKYEKRRKEENTNTHEHVMVKKYRLFDFIHFVCAKKH